PTLTAQPSAGSIQAGETVRVCGTITGAREGQAIYLQRQEPGGIGFHTLAQATLTSGSSYCLEHTPPAAGIYLYRVKVPRGAETQAVASALMKVTVEPRPAAPLAPASPEIEDTGGPLSG
ncbi:MAG TPA: hypothetical protein VLZ06_10615, partial [Solirubrobacteraceae bacterium]|nr:hypothetical protein [Solirubrobacteraceae bacterium]